MLVKQWDEEFSHEETLRFLTECALQHLSRVSHESGALLAAEIQARNWDCVVGWNVDYDSGISITDAINIRQALGFFTKLESLPLGVDKETVARDRFLADEDLCRKTNEIFAHWFHGDLSFPRDVELVLFKAQRKIANVLGPVPKLSSLRLVFGPGATTSVPKKNACARVKLNTRPSCSANLVNTLPELLEEMPAYSRHHCKVEIREESGEYDEVVLVDVVPGRLAFVPKNAKTYRSVMTEPTLNAMHQGAYGSYIRQRLLGVGQNIRDQAINQRRACEGSVTGKLATIDLSSASDTLAKGLVEHLLPYDWYAVLSESRTATCSDDVFGEINLQKFSSMGNGYTFPLQTLIFWALTASCQENREDEIAVTCYGDDIICPVVSMPLLLRVFSAVGFRVNMEKSYWGGPFRESCGKDYYFGIDIRPFYQKDLVSGVSLFALHNFYVRNYEDELAAFVRKHISDDIALYGPDGFGDGHLLGDWMPQPKGRDRGWAGFCFDTYSLKGVFHKKILPGDRILPAYSVYVGADVCILPETAQQRAISCFNSAHRRHGFSSPTGSWTTAPHPKRVRRGVVWDSLPNTRGYVKQTIYTLSR